MSRKTSCAMTTYPTGGERMRVVRFIILIAITILSVGGIAHAASQDGGLPAVQVQVDALQAQLQALQTMDTTDFTLMKSQLAQIQATIAGLVAQLAGLHGELANDVANLNQKITSISLTPGPVGPKGDSGPIGPSGRD